MQEDDRPTTSPLALLVGIVADSALGGVAPLLRNLAELSVAELQNGAPPLGALDVIVLENGPRSTPDGSYRESQLWQEVSLVQRETGLRCSIIPLERQLQDVRQKPTCLLLMAIGGEISVMVMARRG